jgi:hypothetical protein
MLNCSVVELRLRIRVLQKLTIIEIDVDYESGRKILLMLHRATVFLLLAICTGFIIKYMRNISSGEIDRIPKVQEASRHGIIYLFKYSSYKLS